MSEMKGKIAVVLSMFFVCFSAEIQTSRKHIFEILARLERIENKLNNARRVKAASVKTCTDCPDTWIRFKDSCYLFEEIKYSFYNARLHCQHLGADLVHINNFAENEFLRHHLKTLKSIDFWIGLEDTDKEGFFKWVDDHTTPAFTGWDKGQPNNFGGREDCAHFRSSYNYNWNDDRCQSAFGSICEMKSKV